jgi:hypothetical protein
MPLSDTERAVLTALARIGGADADLKAIEAVSQAPAASLIPALERLCDLRLVEGGGDRYAIATLALQRIFDRLLGPGAERKRAAAFFAGAAVLHVGDLAWLETEFANLTAAIKTALEAGESAQAGELARAIQPLQTLRGYWAGWGQTIDWAEQAARAGGDRALEAWALHERGTRAGLLGDDATAAMNLDRARRRRESLGDRAGAAASERNMAYLDLIVPAPPADQRQPTALKWGLAALLLLLAIGGGWLTLAPLLAGTPPTPSPAAQPTGAPGIVAITTPGTATPDDPSPTIAPTTAAPVATTPPATPTPTATPTRPPTPTPGTPTATPLPTCRVLDAPVNLRGGPGTAYPALTGALASGTVLEPLGRSSSGGWLNVRVQATGRRGWVIANPTLIACTIPAAELPVVAAPPLPPPRPTATPAPIPTETAAPTVPPEVVAPPTPTNTAVPPTNTAVPPTDTPAPTATPEPTIPPPTATFTPLPPTPTPTPTIVPG